MSSKPDLISEPDPRTLTLDFYPHHHTFETRSTDSSDKSGHIPNGTIADYCDDGRLGMHRIIRGDADPFVFQLVESRFRFFHELRFPGPVTIGVGIASIGSSSMHQIAGFFRDGRCHVLASLVMVKVIDGASSPLTADERSRAERFVLSMGQQR